MAQIREFAIEGLAGKTEPYSLTLNSDVNVFFGLNGSGKTTLLKILHSALSADTDILKDLPFTRAEVKIYLNRYKREFTRTYAPPEKASEKEIPPQSSLPLHNVGRFAARETTATGSSGWANLMFNERLKAVVEAPKWVSDPPEPEGKLTSHSVGFLPISRLYRNVLTSSGAKRLSDQELDSAFARGYRHSGPHTTQTYP